MTDQEIETLFATVQASRHQLVVVRELISPIFEEVQPIVDSLFCAIALAQGEAVIRLINEKGMTADQAIAIVIGSGHLVTSAVNNVAQNLKKATN